MKTIKVLKASLLFTVLLTVTSVFAQSDMMKSENKMVGGAEMYPSKDHTTLVAAVKAADLVGVLTSEGPFTVFAPVNEAFAKLPEGTVANLLKPENKSALQTILKYHVVAGKVSASQLQTLIAETGGKATLETVSGGNVIAWIKDGAVYVTDENGNSAKVTIADVNQSNGVIHVIDTVLLPKS